MPDKAPQIPADAIADVLTFGSLEPLVPYYPQFAERLRAAKIGEPTATDIAIRARLMCKILKAEGWTATAIIETILTRSFDGVDTHGPKVTKIVHDNAGSAVNKPADALFDELKRSPRPLRGRPRRVRSTSKNLTSKIFEVRISEVVGTFASS